MTEVETARAGPPLSDKGRYQAYAFCWADILFETELDLTIRHAAGACEPLVGRSAGSLVGGRLDRLVAPADQPNLIHFLARIRECGRAGRTIVRIAGPRGMIVMAIAGYAVDPDNGPVFVALRHLTPEERAATDAAARDETSSLLDSDAYARIAAERVRAMAQRGMDAEIGFIELEGYEAVTQRLDEDARQDLERRIGNRLRGESIGGDSAGQVGEGRFSLVTPADGDLDGLSDELRQMTSEADPEGRGASVTTARLDTGDADQLDEADLARGLLFTLNEFRSHGAGHLTVADLTSNLSSLVAKAAGEVSSFKAIVRERSFDMALQPIVDLKTGLPHHFEALCRFRSDEAEISPYRMITFAEDTGMIHEFDLAMIQKVIGRLRKTPVNAERYRIAVNVSGHSIGEASFIAALHRLLQQEDWTAGRLIFEITESARMTDLDAANRFIQDLRQRGYVVCLDDFGAGAASFQYLSRLEVDVVKLDGSAVRNARAAGKGRAFLSALTELCRRLNVQTIAEMIDDEDGLAFVRDCGCDYVQGYLFGRPAPAFKDFTPLPNARLLKNHRGSMRLAS